jgi:hypothetical protein
MTTSTARLTAKIAEAAFNPNIRSLPSEARFCGFIFMFAAAAGLLVDTDGLWAAAVTGAAIFALATVASVVFAAIRRQSRRRGRAGASS